MLFDLLINVYGFIEVRVGKEYFIDNELFKTVIGLYKVVQLVLIDRFVQNIIPQIGNEFFQCLCQFFIACTDHIRIFNHVAKCFGKCKTFLNLFKCHSVVGDQFEKIYEVSLPHCVALNGGNTIFNKEIIERFVILQIGLIFTFFVTVKWWLCKIEVSFFNDRLQESEEEGHKQGLNVRTIDVGIGHDDDLVVSEFLFIELFTDTAAKCRDHIFDLV